VVPPDATPLDGDLTVLVWSPKGDGTKRGLSVAEPGALPVRNIDMVHLRAELNRPAHVYLLWIGGEGRVEMLHPQEAGRGSAASSPGGNPARVVDSPPELDGGWYVKGLDGLETALLLARPAPLAAEVDLPGLVGRLPPTPLTDPRERRVWKLGLGRSEPQLLDADHRGLDTAKSQRIDDPLLQLLERLRPHFDLIHVVRFAHTVR
jgi:hypothetical protein